MHAQHFTADEETQILAEDDDPELDAEVGGMLDDGDPDDFDDEIDAEVGDEELEDDEDDEDYED